MKIFNKKKLGKKFIGNKDFHQFFSFWFWSFFILVNKRLSNVNQPIFFCQNAFLTHPHIEWHDMISFELTQILRELITEKQNKNNMKLIKSNMNPILWFNFFLNPSLFSISKYSHLNIDVVFFWFLFISSINQSIRKQN